MFVIYMLTSYEINYKSFSSSFFRIKVLQLESRFNKCPIRNSLLKYYKNTHLRYRVISVMS